MNKIIVNNWNNLIKPSDKVFFLGDLSFRSHSTEFWIPLLNGKIIFIRGNHDRFYNTHYFDNYVLKYKENLFYLVHNPHHVPKNWHEQIICGHTHNKIPFFNKINKSFNISTDVTNFKPVNMEYINSLTKV
jgi:calcineurin-like phosphoesterase family protein